MFQNMLVAGFGGFFGTCVRFIVNKIVGNFSLFPVPLATFIVNLIGCFLFGLFVGWLEKSEFLSPSLYALLVTGFCGGLTTFSTFSNELFNLSSKGEIFVFLTYLICSILFGILLIWTGRICVR